MNDKSILNNFEFIEILHFCKVNSVEGIQNDIKKDNNKHYVYIVTTVCSEVA
jgi:hypothetical protein